MTYYWVGDGGGTSCQHIKPFSLLSPLSPLDSFSFPPCSFLFSFLQETNTSTILSASMSQISPLLFILVVAAALYSFISWIRKKPLAPLPPGPPGKPIIGNLWDLPPNGGQDWLHWQKHKVEYGMKLYFIMIIISRLCVFLFDISTPR